MLVPLIDYMASDLNESSARAYAAMALGNLASEVDNHAEIIESKGESSM
jgi:hypothetical protein